MFVFSWTPEQREEWMDESLCAQTDPEVFFPDAGEPGNAAKEVCASCDVREKCLEYAVRNRIDHGIWGGMGTTMRRKLWDEADKPAFRTRLDVPKFRRLYSEGHSDTEIARHLDCDPSAVAKLRQRFDLPQQFYRRTA